MKKIHLISFSVLSGILLALSWPLNGFPFLLLFAFVPLFHVEDWFFNQKSIKEKSIFWYGFLTFLVWNTLTVWWVINSTIFGGIAAILLNTSLMSVTFYLYHITRKAIRPSLGQLILVFFWIAFEVFHMNWDLTFPWLNLGNGFAAYPQFIQWYDLTGALGGTVWILLINILIFYVLKNYLQPQKNIKIILSNILFLVLFLAVPIGYSIYTYHHYQEEKRPITAIAVQPNNDPYTAQYRRHPLDVVSRIIFLADSTMKANHIDKNQPHVIVAPESTIQERPLYEDYIKQGKTIQYMMRDLEKHPERSFIIGASTYYQFKEGEEITLSARKIRGTNKYYDAYNTAIFMDSRLEPQLYHKSKLTPGVEKMPFKRIFKPIEKLALNLGGTVGTLGTDKIQKPLINKNGVAIASVICYESVYGEFCTRYVKNGAQLLSIITNDGWWGNTPGHRQHLVYAAVRAIETRRSIVRSANTGISAFFNQRGDIFQETDYWEETAIQRTLNLNDKLTFYVKYGDYIGRISIFTSILLLLILISKRWIGN